MTSCITCNKHCSNTVDFIVVGMGAGGATVLRMLYDAGFIVAGIEAGGNHDDDELILDPTNAGELEEKYTWKYFFEQTTEPNEDMAEKVLNYTTGRMVGGGTSINGMQYVRASDKFWDEWAAVNGSAWSASQIALDFKALENFAGVSGQFVPAVHGVDGKMQIRQAPTTPSDLTVDFATALAGVTGQPLIPDYNNPTTPVGTFTRWSLFQQPNGDRASSSIDFLTDVVDETGKGRAGTNGRIRVFQNSTVNKVLFNDQNCLQKTSCSNVARGVEYIQFGETKQLYARREVILCAGIHSNEILQRSGVGPKALLESLEIPVVFDNANVGAGSRNHLITTAFFHAPIAKSNGADPKALYAGGAFLPTPINTPNPVSTDRGFQWIGVDASDGTDGGLAVIFYNLKPQSIGSDRLQDRDPFRVTDVAENLLSEPQDLVDIMNVYKQQVTALNTALGLILTPTIILLRHHSRQLRTMIC